MAGWDGLKSWTIFHCVQAISFSEAFAHSFNLLCCWIYGHSVDSVLQMGGWFCRQMRVCFEGLLPWVLCFLMVECIWNFMKFQILLRQTQTSKLETSDLMWPASASRSEEKSPQSWSNTSYSNSGRQAESCSQWRWRSCHHWLLAKALSFLAHKMKARQGAASPKDRFHNDNVYINY